MKLSARFVGLLAALVVVPMVLAMSGENGGSPWDGYERRPSRFVPSEIAPNNNFEGPSGDLAGVTEHREPVFYDFLGLSGQHGGGSNLAHQGSARWQGQPFNAPSTSPFDHVVEHRIAGNRDPGSGDPSFIRIIGNRVQLPDTHHLEGTFEDTHERVFYGTENSPDESRPFRIFTEKTPADGSRHERFRDSKDALVVKQGLLRAIDGTLPELKEDLKSLMPGLQGTPLMGDEVWARLRSHATIPSQQEFLRGEISLRVKWFVMLREANVGLCRLATGLSRDDARFLDEAIQRPVLQELQTVEDHHQLMEILKHTSNILHSTY